MDGLTICETCKKKKSILSFYTSCYDCRKKEEMKRIQESAIKDGETSYVDVVVCPHCGSHYGEDEMNETEDVECYECEKKFRVEVEYSVSYSTYKLGA